MARTIRLNSADGSAASSGGLTAANVTTQIQDQAQWTLDREQVFTDTPATQKHLVFEADFENVASYHCILKGFTDSSGAGLFRLHFMEGGQNIGGNSQWTYTGRYGTTWGQSNTTFGSGEFYPQTSQNDSYQEGSNFRELLFHINNNEADSNGRRYVNIEYKAYVPWFGGYQSYSQHWMHYINCASDWDNVKFDMNGQNFAAPSQVKLNPVIQVYKQLRAPAS